MTLGYGVVAVIGAILLHRAAPAVGTLVGLAFLSAFSAALLPSVFASVLGPRFCCKEASLMSITAATVYTLYSLVSGSFIVVHPMLGAALIATGAYVVIGLVTRVTGPWWGGVAEPVSRRTVEGT